VDPDTADGPTADPSENLLIGFNELRTRQERLRDSVEDIQKQLAEKKKPWYRQTSTLMSVAGTIFAILSGIYSIHSTKMKDVNQNAADLHTTVAELIQLHSDEAQDTPSSNSDFTAYALRSSLRNAKRIELLEQAKVELKAASNRVSPSILTLLAAEVDFDGDYKTSRDYLMLALQKAQPHSPEQIGALFTLAQLCLTDGKALCKLGEGKSFYQSALDEQPGDSDNTHYERGQLLTRVALLVHQANQDETQANSYFDQANSEESQITPTNPERQKLAQYITTARASVASSSKPQSESFSTPGAFLGRWHLIDTDDPSRSGTVTFVQLPAFPFYGADVDIFQGGKLWEKQSGQVLITDPNTLRFDWTSIGVSGQSAGYSQFFLSPEGGITGKQYRLGEDQWSFSLRR
jgi:hypothetical protein